MSETVFVTGATGLAGANICKLLVERGDTVRALARSGADTDPLAALGVEIVTGDITDADDVRLQIHFDGVVKDLKLINRRLPRRRRPIRQPNILPPRPNLLSNLPPSILYCCFSTGHTRQPDLLHDQLFEFLEPVKSNERRCMQHAI